jgi:mRNA interferase MazF
MAKAPRPQRGEIWSVQFDPSIGAEIRKVRPAVVANLDAIGRLPLRIVVPLTDWQPSFGGLPWFVPVPGSRISGLIKDSGADAFQIKSVSENRFVRRIGKVTDAQMEEIAAAIALCVGAP